MSKPKLRQNCWRSSTVERLACTQDGVGSNPAVSSKEESDHSGVAQLVERPAVNRERGGSSPSARVVT